MAQREETRNLETIPVGSLGIIPLEGCKSLGEKVDHYLVKWRTIRESEHKESLAFAGYQRDFSEIFGFDVDGVDYEADVDTAVGIESIAE